LNSFRLRRFMAHRENLNAIGAKRTVTSHMTPLGL
jgi:hypothetical protein